MTCACACLEGHVDIGHFGTERPSACGIMSLEETVKGLHAASEYLVRTKGLVSGETFEQVEEQQCRAWVSNIQKLRITEVTDSTEVMETISSGAWTNARKQRLFEAVAKRGQQGGGAASPIKQSMVNWVAYMTLAEKNYLGSGCSNVAKLDLLSTRMLKIGLTSPTERSAGHVVASLGHPTACMALVRTRP